MRAVMRCIACGVAGAAAWNVGMQAVFFPLQPILGDPERQSAKFIHAFIDAENPPHMAPESMGGDGPWVMYAIFAAGGFCAGLAYCLLRGRLWVGGTGARAGAAETTVRGLVFGVASWLVMVPWFEGYLPWNVMREPAGLVALEMACWIGVLVIVGQAVAWTHAVAGECWK